jgi:hypothetical protein
MMALLILLLILALFGFGFALKALWIAALIVFAFWIAGFFLGRSDGSRWYRW